MMTAHRIDPNCHWCDRETKLYGQVNDPLLASWDHIYSRLNPNRNRYNQNLRVLSCLSCNHKRAIYDLSRYNMASIHLGRS